MPQTIPPPVLTAERIQLSDEVLSQIINALALSGEQPIAQLATFIKTFRRLNVPLESGVSKIWRDSYEESLCASLYIAMIEAGAIDGFGALRLERLRERFKPKREEAIC